MKIEICYNKQILNYVANDSINLTCKTASKTHWGIFFHKKLNFAILVQSEVNCYCFLKSAKFIIKNCYWMFQLEKLTFRQ